MGPLPVLMVLVIYHGRAWYLHSVVLTHILVYHGV